jgi:hypothetical protein
LQTQNDVSYSDIEDIKKNIRKTLYEEARLMALENAVKSATKIAINTGADPEWFLLSLFQIFIVFFYFFFFANLYIMNQLLRRLNRKIFANHNRRSVRILYITYD